METINDTLTIPLNHARFHLGDVPDAWQAWYEDDDWESVALPHDWSVHMPFSKEYSSGTGYLAGGIGWYRIRVTPDAAWRGKQIRIHFDSIYKNSRVWCNSTYLGERPNGYISFGYDVTDCFRFDADNIISVYVDRREISDSRWFTGSGITGGVTLSVSENIYPADNGIFFHTTRADDNSADYEIVNDLVNATGKSSMITVTNVIFDDTGKLVGEAVSQTTILAHASMRVTNTGTIQAPKLWSPEAPNLYTVKTYISYQKSYQVHEMQVGIRSFRFHPDRGFFLNGKPYLFKGVCLHHDAGCLGAAVPCEVWWRRLAKLKKMGCNAIRMSHNPHTPELYTLCDVLGFFVIDEAFDEWEGPKNKWWQGHNVYPPKNQGYYTAFPAWHERDLTDMILRDRNHPSVILWSIGNEIDYPNDPYCHPSFVSMPGNCVTGNNDANKPEAERMYNPARPNAERLTVLAKHLCDIAKTADTTHPVTLAAAFPELSAKLGFIDAVDVAGYNYRENLYAEHHLAFPDKPFLGSENGHGFHEWRAVTDNDYISGQFLWTGIDYLGEAHGWPIHGSGAGLLTLAGFEKPGYYRRQSFWSDEPMIHLTTVRETDSCVTSWGETAADAYACEFAASTESWNYCAGEMVTVKCYTNLTSVELFLNDRSLGIYKKEADRDCILTTVKFEPGTLTAKGSENDTSVSHSLYTVMAACQMDIQEYTLPQEARDIIAGAAGCCNPVHQLEITMLDSNGRRVYHDSTLLHVHVDNGTLLGIENGDLADVTEYTANYRRAYRGQLMVYVAGSENTSTAAPLTVTVRGDMVRTETVRIK
ncbi:MAG: glycoside hydrolase family 2 protein [Lachnospiraceae bacterium]|nr:glycoside hydrolase family 2 protein [Lachnospiraceae bacterium]